MKIPSDGGLQRVTFHGTGAFLKTVRERVHETVAALPHKGAPKLQRKSAIVIAWFAASFILMLAAKSAWLEIACCVSYGLAASAVGFNIFHDANHGAIASSNRANVAAGMLASMALGPSRYLWNHKHNVLHHRYTNLHGWDDDLETRGFLRISPQQDWAPRFRGQHIFVFALYAINAFEMVFVKDFIQYFTLRMGPHQRIPAMSGPQKLEFWASKLVYLAVFVSLPLAVMPWQRVMIALLIYQVTLGLSLALVFSMAHQVETVEFPAPHGQPAAIAEEWAAHQMRTTVNFANANPLLNWYTGGLNHQIEHHLFPAMSHTHYGAIRPVVRDTAREFGLPYNHFETWGAALGSHYRLLRRLGRRPLPVPVPLPLPAPRLAEI